MEPTLFDGVDNLFIMAPEEIFGPVLTVVSVAGEAKAILLRNDTIYGLNASVFTNDVDRARQVAAGFARAPSVITRCAATSASPLAASSSQESDANADGKAFCRIWRPRPLFWKEPAPSRRAESPGH